MGKPCPCQIDPLLAVLILLLLLFVFCLGCF